jgi:predicted phage tail component-like protein
MELIYPLATPQTIDLGTVDLPTLPAPEFTAWTVDATEFEIRALLRTGHSPVMWDGEELSAGWVFVSDLHEQLLPRNVTTIDVPGRDGAIFGGVTQAVRQLTLSLYVLGRPDERAEHVRELAARLAVDGPRPLRFRDELTRMAIPNADVMSTVYFNAEGWVDVTFECPDPWLYGEVRTATIPSGGSVTINVGGTAPTWPTIECDATGGTQDSWVVTLDGGPAIYAAIPSGTELEVTADCGARTLMVNREAAMLPPAYDWPMLTPGEHTLAMSQGTGDATVTWRERWW